MASHDQLTIAGIPVDNSEINMAVRSVIPVAMDEATAASTATSSAAVPPSENIEMGGTSEGTLDFSLSPAKDEPPASRPKKDGVFGTAVLALQTKKGPTVRKRPSSMGPPRQPRSRMVEATSPWPDSISADHARATNDDNSWTSVKIAEQLEAQLQADVHGP